MGEEGGGRFEGRGGGGGERKERWRQRGNVRFENIPSQECVGILYRIVRSGTFRSTVFTRSLDKIYNPHTNKHADITKATNKIMAGQKSVLSGPLSIVLSASYILAGV